MKIFDRFKTPRARARRTFLKNTGIPIVSSSWDAHDTPFIVLPEDFWCQNCKDSFAKITSTDFTKFRACDECQMLGQILKGART